MKSVIKIDEKIVKQIAKQIVMIEKNNLKTKELSDSQMITEIKKIIEGEVEVE
jgi:hypothetical protein